MNKATEYPVLDEQGRLKYPVKPHDTMPEGATVWLGVTTTALTDGATTNPITINGESVTVEIGGTVGYQGQEFVFDGTQWQALGKTELPAVTSADNGDALGVVEGQWDVLDLSGQIAHLQEQIDDLNYHEITLSVSVSPNTAEIGSVPSSVTVSWTCNKKPTTLTVAGQNVSNPGKTGSLTISSGITGSTQSFTVVAVDERNHTETKTATLNYYNRVFWGAAAEASTVTAGTGTLSNTKARTISGVTAGSGEYVWYILPHRLCSIAPKFTVGGFEGGFSLNKTENWTNSSGYTESYDYYRSDNAALGAVTVVVS